ncbi:hypothetical protein OUZ56_000696 [Daphnia magna]|uniref:Uncharacterized protein n=1 Tax=Daphnia magna TaxID=35525 RepID=A0ABR0A0G9_9CRUS|nr:hypothetical protein OUZ56_000696 [Daphnia magna]
MVVDVVLVRPLRGHRYKVTIHRTALMNPMKRQIDIRESKELSTGKAEGRIPIDSEGQTNKQHFIHLVKLPLHLLCQFAQVKEKGAEAFSIEIGARVWPSVQN